MLRPGFERLHGPLDVELPAETTPVGIPFPPPQPAGGAESGKPAAGAASKPPADQRPVVSAGLVCLVADAAQPDLQWNTWIDFALRPPRDYLESQVVYDPAGQRIAIRVRPRDADGDGQPNVELLPPSVVEEPIAVAWDTAGVLAAGTEMKDQAELAAPGYAATLFAKVEPQAEKLIPVRLTIDGYPRAFLYRVRCDRTGRPAEPERSPCRIRITSPAAGDAFLAPAEAIPVEFQVDAPEDAFQKPGDVVELGLDEDGDRTLRQERKLQWYSDRQVTVRLHKVDPDGHVQFHAEVADFKVPVPAGGLRNKKVDVLARLIVNLPVTGQGQLTDQSDVSVVLDGAPPILRMEVPVRPIMAGEEIPVTIVTEDLSGVAKGRVGLDLNASGDLEDADQPLLLTAPTSGGVWTIGAAHEGFAARTLHAGGPGHGSRGLVGQGHRNCHHRRAAERTPSRQTAGRHRHNPRPSGPDQPSCLGHPRDAGGPEPLCHQRQRRPLHFPRCPRRFLHTPRHGAALNRFRRGTASVTVPGGQQTVTVEVQVE